MNTTSLVLPLSDLEQIASNIGSRWNMRGASQSLPDGSFAMDKVFISTSMATVTICASLVDVLIGEEPDEVVSITIVDDPVEVRLASTRGRLYFQFKDEIVHSISIVRDITRRFVGEKCEWTLIADRGVIFELESGSLAICTGGDFTTDFFISTSLTGERLEVPDFRNLWESTLEERYETTRHLIPIEDLLPRTS
ncbi:MAG: hypothetical protein KGR18_05470 [Acidobacteria bacterium]|nr:hypothetical protein [Acidobacteriota bacterium]